MKKVYINEEFKLGVDVAESYCTKKSALWNRFFGWRMATQYKMGRKICDCHMYKLPDAVANILSLLAIDEREVTVV